MNLLKKTYIINGLLCLMLISSNQAKIVNIAEDGYMMQAPQELEAVAEKAAGLVNFTTPYELVVPKKAAIEINPWNKFASYVINPVTKNPFLIINPEWFNKLPEDQQLFLLGRNFLLMHYGVIPTSFTMIQYLFVFLSLLLLLFLIWIMGKTVLKNQRMWVRILLAGILVGLCEFMVLDPLEKKLKQCYGKIHDRKINKLVIEKINNKDAAIKALEYYESSIKNEIKNGETFFVPFENLFESYAQDLK